MPDRLESMLQAWGRTERSEMANEPTDLHTPVAEALRQSRGEGRPAIAARLTFRRWAALAAALLVAALAGLLVTRQPGAPTQTTVQPAPVLVASDFTLLGLMRANDGYASEELALPESSVVAWTSRVPALPE